MPTKTEKITVAHVITSPTNRYESIMLMSCGHWFAAKTGDAHHEGATFDRSQCGPCSALLMLIDDIKHLEAGSAILRAENDKYRSAHGPIDIGAHRHTWSKWKPLPPDGEHGYRCEACDEIDWGK